MNIKKKTIVQKTNEENFKPYEFKYGKYSLVYPKIYYQFLKEQFIYDMYQTSFLKRDDLVLDLGANIGAFSVLASKKVGKNGKVIAVEPNIEDYKTLDLNIRRNNCQNVTPINLGVGKEIEEKETSFFGRSFTCKLSTLEDILHDLSISERINFVKMDIEGYEVDVIRKSIRIFKNVDVISIECHATKKQIDQLLLPLGFSFRPLTTSYMYKRMFRNLLFHPHQFIKANADTIAKNPRLLYKVLRGYDIYKDLEENKNSDEVQTAIGTYVRTV